MMETTTATLVETHIEINCLETETQTLCETCVEEPLELQEPKRRQWFMHVSETMFRNTNRDDAANTYCKHVLTPTQKPKHKLDHRPRNCVMERDALCAGATLLLQ